MVFLPEVVWVPSCALLSEHPVRTVCRGFGTFPYPGFCLYTAGHCLQAHCSGNGKHRNTFFRLSEKQAKINESHIFPTLVVAAKIGCRNSPDCNKKKKNLRKKKKLWQKSYIHIMKPLKIRYIFYAAADTR